MDKSTSAVCNYFNQGTCDKELCPFRHVNLQQKTIVCKHWLRALCKKGDSCEFLHEYDMTKMPECYFYSRFNTCHKKECTFLHIDPESKIKDCAWYDRGFCRHGPSCRHRHVRRVLCKNYLAGLCPDGPGCKFMHPRFELPPASDLKDIVKRPPVCHNCGELGHKASFCPKLPPEQREILERQNMMKNPPIYNHHLQQKLREQQKEMAAEENQQEQSQPDAHASPQIPNIPSGPPPISNNHGPPNFHQNHNQPRPPFQHRKLEDITCYKCGMKGHYANRCYSFLNNNFSGGNNKTV